MPLEKEDLSEDEINHKWMKVKSLAFGQSTREEQIVQQGKCLCGHFIRARLRRAGILNRKVTQRLRTILDIPASSELRDVFPALIAMCEELERMHPRVYMNVSRQLSRTPFGELQEAHSAPYLLNIVAKDLFKTGVNWGKIVSVFAISGGLAIDIVRQGHYDYLQRLIEGTADIIEEDLVPWLIENGGWLGLLEHIRPNIYPQFSVLGWLSIIVAILFVIYVITFIIKYIVSNFCSFLL